jgi:hypothetical protein
MPDDIILDDNNSDDSIRDDYSPDANASDGVILLATPQITITKMKIS